MKDVPNHPWDEGEFQPIFAWGRPPTLAKLQTDLLTRVAVHPNLFMACQMPNTRHGEQLFVQFLSTSANRMWLWQKGRFQMGFLGADAFWTVSHSLPLGPLRHPVDRRLLTRLCAHPLAEDHPAPRHGPAPQAGRAHARAG